MKQTILPSVLIFPSAFGLIASGRISIGYTMEKCGVGAHITNEFVVIPKAKPREITTNELVIRSTYTTLFHSVFDLY